MVLGSDVLPSTVGRVGSVLGGILAVPAILCPFPKRRFLPVLIGRIGRPAKLVLDQPPELYVLQLNSFCPLTADGLPNCSIRNSDFVVGKIRREERHASLTRRLATKQAEKGRYVKLYAQGHLDEEELEVHLADLKNQVENLKLLISSVEADFARKEEDKLTAQTTEAWLLTLRERVEEVEEDTEEALEKRRELVKLLVERINVDPNEDGRTQVRITYRFGPPPEEPESVYGVAHTRESRKTQPPTPSCPYSSNLVEGVFSEGYMQNRA
jgi:hypothetical protein